MRISEYIGRLEEIRREHGDLEVQTHDFDYCRTQAQPPKVAFARILRGRERNQRFWGECYGEERKGEKVCRL